MLIDLKNDRKMHVLLPFDGDGNSSDCQVINGNMQCSPIKMTGPSEMMQAYFYSTLTGIDFSQQGASDFIIRWVRFLPYNDPSNFTDIMSGLAACYNGQSGITCQTIFSGHSGVIASDTYNVGDLNGDGLTDFAYSVTGSSDASVNGVYVCLSKENSIDCKRDTSLSTIQNVPASFSAGSKVGNFTGDGINRVLFAVVPQDSNNQPNLSAAKSNLCQYTSSGFACKEFSYSPAAGTEGLPVTFDDSGLPMFVVKSDVQVEGLDPNGIGPWDGVTSTGTTMQQGYKTVGLVQVAEQDKIVAVTNGIGQREEVSYAYGDDVTVYARVATIDGTLRNRSPRKLSGRQAMRGETDRLPIKSKAV